MHQYHFTTTVYNRASSFDQHVGNINILFLNTLKGMFKSYVAPDFDLYYLKTFTIHTTGQTESVTCVYMQQQKKQMLFVKGILTYMGFNIYKQILVVKERS